MKKPKTKLEALIKSREHWLDVIRRYPETRNEIYGWDCPLCVFVRGTNKSAYGHPCVLAERADGICDYRCCEEWRQCKNVNLDVKSGKNNTADFIPAAKKMVARLEKEIAIEVSKNPPKAEDKTELKIEEHHQFEHGDVLKDSTGIVRICVLVDGMIRAYSFWLGNGYIHSQEYIEHCGYRKIGELKDFF